MDALLLSRIQFAANISFHILFPTITIALGWVLLFFKLRFNASGEEKWMDAYKFWVKVFALTFAMGVVSGITMSFQFGTNWPGFMETVGNVAGPLLAYEVLTAFFLEAVFLGIMLFGMHRVPGWLHTTATALVAFGTTMSAFWILVLNSWMHTPQGHEIRDGVVHAVNWFEIIFNPSMPYRLTHMLLASFLTVSFVIAGISAFRWLLGERSNELRATLKTGLTLGAILIPVQMFVGDQHGLNTEKYQPAKIAAMEANWDHDKDVPLVLFAIPDEEARMNHFEIGIPHGASLILTHTWDGGIPKLDDYITEDGEVLHPPVTPIFFAFRIMVGTGLLMLLVSWSAMWFMRRKAGPDALPRPLLYLLVPMAGAGWLATLSGWYVTEIGRQPWLVHGILSTKAAVGDVAPTLVLSTLIAYLIVYGLLLITYIGVVFYLARKAALGDTTTGAPEQGRTVPAE